MVIVGELDRMAVEIRSMLGVRVCDVLHVVRWGGWGISLKRCATKLRKKLGGWRGRWREEASPVFGTGAILQLEEAKKNERDWRCVKGRNGPEATSGIRDS